MSNNNNGTKVIHLAISKDLVVSSTFFPRKDIFKHTWISPDAKTKNQIDHVIIYRRHKTCITNVRSYRGADGDSDHYLVITNLMPKFSVNWKKEKKERKLRAKKFSADKAKNPAEVQAYQINLADMLNRKNVQHNDIEEAWIKIKETVNEAAENLQVLGLKKNNKWFNIECHEVIRERDLCRIKMLKNTTQENIQAYLNARSQASKILRQSKRLAEKKLIEDIEIYKRNPRLFFEKCKSVK